jgi:membrane protease YdiL (CAAX protease family)
MPRGPGRCGGHAPWGTLRAVRAVAQALALRPCPGLLRDPHFLLGIAAGVAFWAALALLGQARPPDPARLRSGAYLYLALAAPVLEELAFRGALMGWLLDYGWGRRRLAGLSGANWAASVLFTAAHFAYHPPLWAALVMAPSLLFGHLRDRTGSVVPGLLLHVLYNAGYFALTPLPGGP